MRKEKREQITNVLKRMEEAHIVIKKQIEKNNIQPALVLIEDCQNAIISIGKQIEKAEGADCPTIHLLENYCEQIYQLYETLSGVVSKQANVNEQNVNGSIQTLDELLEQISDSVQNEITVRKEVVFLPYKASMWDSLESVWKAADEDPNCNAYVIPIPYFDRTSDGGFGEMHYEGDLYPKYVPVTDYKEFDFEEHRPDMIYIHNPYDEYNLVTSVYPDFYSKKLMEYTENLIYIPYFVLGEVDIENEAAIKDIEHFCKTSAVLNADKVIVQSEQMKQVYVKILTKWQGEYTRQKWEEKILGLGSPKLDKVTNTKKEDVEIPKDWLRIIEKPDGSWKKVVFYNTSLNAFLINSDIYLDKLEEVLRIFKENQDEVALLWRPHPLIMSTIESIKPKLKDRFTYVIQKYKNEEWGIYDESAELDRAIAISDVYYGDPSSVAVLFQNEGKPTMMQEVTSALEGIHNRGVLQFVNAVSYKGKKYFSAWNGDGIFSCDLKEDKIQLETFISKNPFSKQQFSKTILVGNQLYLAPISCDYILKVNLDTWEKEKFYLDKKVCGPYVGYQDIFLYERELYFMPVFSKAVCSINVDSGQMTYYDDCYHLIQDKASAIHIWDRGVRVEDEMCFPCRRTNSIVTFNMRTHKACHYEIGDIDREFCDMTYDGKDFWIYSFDGSVIQWNRTEGIIRNVQIDTFEDECSGAISYANGNVWFFVDKKDVYYKIDIRTGCIQKRDGFLSEKTTKELGLAEVSVIDKDIYIYPNHGDLFVKLNADTEEIEIYCMEMGETEYQLYMDKIYDTLMAEVPESVFVHENVFVSCILKKDMKESFTKSFDGVGQQIYYKLVTEAGVK